MKMKDAEKLMSQRNEGYMVHFEWKEGSCLRSDYFPDLHSGEELISTEKKAWDMARLFAERTKGKTVNLYVIDNSFRPVSGYKDKEISNR